MRAWSSALSTIASGQGSPYFSSRSLLQAAGVDADAHGAAMVLGGLDHFAHAVGRADIAGVDAQAGGAGLGGLDAALVVEVDVGDDRHLGCAARSSGSARGGLFVGAGDADDVGAGLFQLADLVDGRRRVRGRRVGHRLDGDRRVAADGHVADADLARLARA